MSHDKYLEMQNAKEMQMTSMAQIQARRQTMIPANAAALGAPGAVEGDGELTVQQQQNIQNMMDCGLTLTGQPMQGTAIQGVSAVNAAGVSVGGGPGPTPVAPIGGQPEHCRKNLQKMLGISPSDIDKYSRIFFPVSFVCFNLMYWIIYLHVSDEVAPDLVMLNG